MANDFSWDVIIRLATQGAKGSADELTRVGDAVDRLQKSGGLTEKQMEQHTRAINKAGQASKSVAKDTTTLQKAQEGLRIAIADQAFSRQTSDLDKVAQAQARVARAVESRKSAEASLDSSRRRGSGEADATRGVTAAVREQIAAEKSLASARERQLDQAISLRYANYDLAQSMFTVSAAIAAMGAGVVVAFASQERAFADVIRTTTDDVSELESAFRSLSTEIPKSFNELAEIGTLGNQLGVSGDQLEAFTRTIAEFSTITGISAEESALAFGKLGNLLNVAPDQYDQLASSIALVGRETAATEKQIISVAGEIAPAAAAAGFTADQVIGLSGALASLKVPPERSRSTVLQFFETLNMAVAEGGDKLDQFAAVVGTTSADLEAMVRSGRGAEIFQQFLGNVSSADTIEITQALEALGLAGLRTNPTIRALAGNMQLVNQSLADGERGFTENVELQRQMDIILSTLSSKWQIFLNAATNVAAVIGASVAPAFANLLEGITNVLIGLQSFAESDFGQGFFRIVGIIAVAVASYAALRGAIALTSAGLLGFATISRAIGGAGLIAGLRGIATSFGLITGSATGATTAMGRFLGVLKTLARATIVLAVLAAASELVFNFGGSMQFLAQVMTGTTQVVGGAVRGLINFVADLVNNLGAAVPAIARYVDYLRAAANLAPALLDQTSVKPFRDWANSLDNASDSVNDFGGAAGAIPFEELTGDTEGWGDSLDGAGDSAAGAAAEVRTLVDYANDLQSVFSRAFDLRFAGGSTLDAITTTFMSIQEATAEAARNIQKLKAEIQGLQSDLSIQEYFLSVAIEYGDSKRAEAIQANIAKIQADLADKTADLSEEQSKNSKELTGNSKAALNNRKQLEDLVKQYQDHITALASSGLSQAELAIRTAQLKEQFIQQATQLGYSRAEIDLYAQSFDDMITIINRLPRNITLDVNADPAIQALSEYEAAINRARANAGQGISLGNISNPTNGKEVRRAGFEANLAAAIARIKELIAAGQVSGSEAIAIDQRIRELVARLQNGNYWSGGFTGTGGKYEPAGIVHRGEYVVPKKDVNQRTGLPYADAMGKLQRGASGPGYAGGGYVAPRGGGMTAQMALSAMGYQQFQQLLVSAMRVSLDGQAISQSNSRQYVEQTAVGAY